jgi:hypothetical protein
MLRGKWERKWEGKWNGSERVCEGRGSGKNEFWGSDKGNEKRRKGKWERECRRFRWGRERGRNMEGIRKESGKGMGKLV